MTSCSDMPVRQVERAAEADALAGSRANRSSTESTPMASSISLAVRVGG